jgi:hypothetical protein
LLAFAIAVTVEVGIMLMAVTVAVNAGVLLTVAGGCGEGICVFDVQETRIRLSSTNESVDFIKPISFIVR